MSKISPLAFIDPEAKIGENCEIGPFCFIDKNVETDFATNVTSPRLHPV